MTKVALVPDDGGAGVGTDAPLPAGIGSTAWSSWCRPGGRMLRAGAEVVKIVVGARAVAPARDDRSSLVLTTQGAG
ncbi:MAG: hypothetical protein ACXV0U_05375 [Kineosporiaceae bacterium]